MLTNTLVLFLRDLLPMFIMFAYLKAIYRPHFDGSLRIWVTVLCGCSIGLVVLFYYENLSDYFEGTGIEWLKIVLVSISFIGFLLSQIFSLATLWNYFLSVAVVCLLSVHFSSFLLYFAVYFAYDIVVFELLIGCLIGVGICVSFYFLYSFFVEELWDSKLYPVILLLWSLFVANQLSLMTNYLHQIDVVDFGTRRFVDLSDWVKEGSEYGFILKALSGFDASPSVFYSLVVAIAFVTMFFLALLNRSHLRQHKKSLEARPMEQTQ